MKPIVKHGSLILATAALLITLNYSALVQAANPAHVKQLLQTKQCPKCDLIGVDLNDNPRVNLSGANLSGARLARAKLQRANLSNAILKDSELIATNLSQASLKKADLRGTFFITI